MTASRGDWTGETTPNSGELGIILYDAFADNNKTHHDLAVDSRARPVSAVETG
jgi:hypothetical protein